MSAQSTPSNTDASLPLQRERADLLCLPMFALSVLFLVLLAGLVVLWVDIPRVAELASLDIDDEDATSHAMMVAEQAASLKEQASSMGNVIRYLLFAIWPLFWLEFLHNLVLQRTNGFNWRKLIHPVLVCIAPPLRLGSTSPAWGDRLWLPALSWQHTGKQLSYRLEQFFTKPMLVIALLILPILLIEFVFKSAVEQYSWLRITLHVATGFIWLAFAFEFIIMVSATDKKLAYVKKNWIDLAIILLPLVSFLRGFRILRLGKVAKLQKLAKLGRVYRMRGLAMKLMRALMLLNVVNRILRVTPEKRLARMREELVEREENLAEFKEEIAELEAVVGQRTGSLDQLKHD